MAIVLSKNLRFTFHGMKADPRGQFIFVKGLIDGAPYTLASLYAPNANQLDFISEALHQLMDFKSGKILIGGDLNYVCDLAMDKSSRIGPCTA